MDRLISLSGGFTTRTAVVVWLLEASNRLSFSLDAAGRLAVSPRAAITQDDDHFIRHHRDELLDCVRYVDEQARKPL